MSSRNSVMGVWASGTPIRLRTRATRLRVPERDRDDQRDERLLLRPAMSRPTRPKSRRAIRLPGEDEDVPGVRVAVEQPVLEELAEGRLDDVLRDLLAVEPGLLA